MPLFISTYKLTNRLFAFSLLLFVQVTSAWALDVKSEIEQLKQLEDKAQVQQHIHSLLDDKTLAPDERFDLLYFAARTSANMNDLRQANSQTLEALTLAEKNNLPYRQAKANKLMGIFHYNKRETEQAIPYYEKAQNLLTVSEHPIEKANLYNNTALAYTAVGKISHALNSYYLADEIYQIHGSDVDKIDIRYNMATTYVRMHRYDMAIEALDEVISKYNEGGFLNGAALAKGDIALSYRHAGNLELSEKYSLEALEYFEEHDDVFYMLSQLCNLSVLNVYKQNYEQALSFGLKGAKLAKEGGYNSAQANCSYNSSLAYFALGELDKSEEFLNVAKTLRKKNEQAFLEMPIEGFSALLHAHQSKFQSALTSFIHWESKISTIHNSKLNEQLVQFEADLLNQKIDSLQQQQELKQKEKVRDYIILGLLIVVVFVIAFLVYRRGIEKEITKRLAIEVKQRTKELEVANDKLKNLSLIDGLTAIYNRRSFDADIKEHWHHARHAKNRQFILCFVDVDYFKSYNDLYGHIRGDEVLQKIAKLLVANLRNGGKAYRYGGEEFAIILPNYEINSVKALAANIETNLKKLAIEHKGSEHGFITLSAGIVLSSEETSLDLLQQKADERLYKAKGLGRARIVTE